MRSWTYILPKVCGVAAALIFMPGCASSGFGDGSKSAAKSAAAPAPGAAPAAPATPGATPAAPGATPDTPGATPSPGSSSDAPTWVNAAALTCDWHSVDTDTTATVQCGLNSADGSAVAPDAKMPVTWTVVDDTGKAIADAGQKAGDSGDVDVLVTLPVEEMAHATVSWQVAAETVPAAGQQAKLVAALPGLDAASDIQPCLAAGKTASDCLTKYLPAPASPAPPPPVQGKYVQIFISAHTISTSGFPGLSNGGGLLLGLFRGTSSPPGPVCVTEAKNAGLSGSWGALVGTTKVALNTLLPADAAVFDVANNSVAKTAADLMLGNLTGVIAVGAKKQPVTASTVIYTGSGKNGALTTQTCDVTASSAGSIAKAGAQAGDWVTSGSQACTLAAHVYCFAVITPAM